MITDNEKKVAAKIANDYKLIQNWINENCIKSGNCIKAREIHVALKDQLTADLPDNIFNLAISCSIRGGYLVGVEGRRGKGIIPVVNSVDELPEPEKMPQEVIDNCYVDNRGKRGRPKKHIVVPSQSESTVSESKDEEIVEDNETEVETPVEAEEKQEEKQEEKPKEKVEENKIEAPKVEKKKEPKVDTLRASYSKHVYRHVWVEGEEIHVPMRFNRLVRLVEILGGRGGNKESSVVFNGRGYSIPNTEMFRKLLVGIMGGISKGQSKPVFEDEDGIPVELKIAG